jgi:hypothetical protein
MRAEVLCDLADDQEELGAPEQSAHLMEQQVADLRKLIEQGARKMDAEVSLQTPWGTMGWQTGLRVAVAQLEQHLGSYRLKQSRNTSDALVRAKLVHSAAEAYRLLLSMMKDIRDPGVLSSFPSEEDIKRVIGNCDAYTDGMQIEPPD